MARLVMRTYAAPYKLVVGGEEKYLCRCGLSLNQPFCDGSHKLAADEPADRLYWYDEAGERHECAEQFAGIRAL